MKKETFIGLFNNYIICIPAIQREYVQGYNEKQTNIVRANFIDDIFDALSKESILDIGIIYGYTQKEESGVKSILFPVDGQQRITTLYVIYWCLSMMKTESEDDILKDKILQYEVRNSTTRSRLFMVCFYISDNLRHKNYNLRHYQALFVVSHIIRGMNLLLDIVSQIHQTLP